MASKSKKSNGSEITVGLAGFGNIGKGVVGYFHKGNGRKFGIRLKTVAVRDTKRKRDISFKTLTTNVNDILEDPQIDIVVELVGGLHPAKELILKALKNEKSVVSANKAVIAHYTKTLFTTANSKEVDLAFEASVGGGIPIIKTIRGLAGERIQRIMGIVNGTTNYILTQMEEGLTFDNALAIAQEKGFAEANHILDTGGFDARDKLTILACLAYNTEINPETIPCVGITDITPVDIEFAKRYRIDEGGKGYAIKLLAIAEKFNGTVSLRVNPVLLPKTHPLATVRDEFNAIYTEGVLAGPQMFLGKGAGTNATTSAVISDIIRVAKNRREKTFDPLPPLTTNVRFAKPGELKKSGYIHLNLKHKPGSLAKAATILARNGLNINDSIQQRRFEQTIKGQHFIPDIITVESVEQKTIEKAVAALSKSDRILGKPFFLPFEH